MKQVLVKQGQAFVEEVPAPQVEPETALVRVDHSCISVGTEVSGIQKSGQSLWKRALQDPAKVGRVIEMATTQGLTRTRNVVKGILDTGSPTGYSAAGTVLEIGQAIDDLKPGDRVACAGAQCAYHAEIINVPRNLTVPVPEGVEFAAASTVALGAIALQGVRRANPTLGETFVVIGLGFLGQLAAQILQANGCRVIGTDLSRERIAQALALGMAMGVHPDDGDDVLQVARLTDGVGADGAIIIAATPSDAVIATAFKMCRRKGRVVLVGDVGLNLNRADFYQKELDFFISTSYGPGRYDQRYEEEGLDYPVGYVRWTENRNMAAYLRLIAEGKVQVRPLIGATYPIGEAAAAYEALQQGEDRPLVALLSYPRPEGDSPPKQVRLNPAAKPAGQDRIRVAIVGAGGFAKETHLPNLQMLADRYHVQAVMSRTGHNANATARHAGAKYATTDYETVLNDADVEAVLITTRHHLHATMTLQALRAGKHVLVEKPLALTQDELDAIAGFYADAPPGEPPPVLLTGFNRRFSRYARRIRELTRNRTNPMIINYRMNAGYIPLDHWVHTAQGGGRNLGEACHIYDLFTYLTDSRVQAVNALAITPTTGHYSRQDNFVVTLAFKDGSVATLTYTALGSRDHPKERMEVYVDGRVLSLDDYTKLSAVGVRARELKTPLPDKGHREELEAFAQTLQQGGDWPIPLWQQLQATQIALRVEAQLGGQG